MLTAFRAYLKSQQLEQAQLIVACSGGIDSVVLSHLCHLSNVDFSIAHCHFGLRGAESDRDADFVKQLAQQYNVLFHIKHFDTRQYGDLKKLSIQEAARELRYAWFDDLRSETGAAWTLLAHHVDDNVETVLMHLFRGTGLHGLTGMPQRAPQSHCLRPLLQHTRAEIETFATGHNLQWVTDSSNESSYYTRNFFRNEVIPLVQQKFGQASSNVLHTMERLQKTEALYNVLLHGLLKKLLVHNGTEHKIAISKLQEFAHTSLPYEVLKKFGFAEKQVPEFLKLTDASSGSYLENDTHRIIKHRNWLLILPQAQLPQTTAIVEAATKKLLLPIGELHFKKRDQFSLQSSQAIAQLDSKQIAFPLVVRRWKEGDYFYPLGLRKKKKLARFFIDQKLSLPQKEAVWVVESASRIVWIIGYRIDDRFKITPTTKSILEISFLPVS